MPRLSGGSVFSWQLHAVQLQKGLGGSPQVLHFWRFMGAYNPNDNCTCKPPKTPK